MPQKQLSVESQNHGTTHKHVKRPHRPVAPMSKIVNPENALTLEKINGYLNEKRKELYSEFK